MVHGHGRDWNFEHCPRNSDSFQWAHLSRFPTFSIPSADGGISINETCWLINLRQWATFKILTAARIRAVWSGVRINGRARHFFLISRTTRPPPGPTRTHIQWVPFPSLPEVKWPRQELFSTHLHLAPKRRMSGAIPPSPYKLNGVNRDRIIFSCTNTYATH